MPISASKAIAAPVAVAFVMALLQEGGVSFVHLAAAFAIFAVTLLFVASR